MQIFEELSWFILQLPYAAHSTFHSGIVEGEFHIVEKSILYVNAPQKPY